LIPVDLAVGPPILPATSAPEISWHRPPFSFSRPDRELTYGELCQIGDVEVALEQLSCSETAAWILDLIRDREGLRATLHACMDALHSVQPRR
jgi:hypothetical protein